MTRRIVLALAWVTLALAFISGLWLTWWLYLLVLSLQIPAWLLLVRFWETPAERRLDRLIRDKRNRRFLKAQGVTCEGLSRPPWSSRSTLPTSRPPSAPQAGPTARRRSG